MYVNIRSIPVCLCDQIDREVRKIHCYDELLALLLTFNSGGTTGVPTLPKPHFRKDHMWIDKSFKFHVRLVSGKFHVTCQCIVTVKHILLHCIKHNAFRNVLFDGYYMMYLIKLIIMILLCF